ncbi:tripartite tricarboxylate transporter substrate-binding protein [Bradyrhizobium daqingense]|uniref:tripartite tricarboxylate transporter substrate-binding protein n=1 Tax=Bradyrhizobium daqingense TaxID=993502 RepID=UPI003835B14E
MVGYCAWGCFRTFCSRTALSCRAAEAGYPGFDISFWVGFFMPKATPTPILETLHREIVAAAKDPAAEEKLGSQGVVSVLGPTEYAAKIAKETKDLAEVVAAANIKAE